MSYLDTEVTTRTLFLASRRVPYENRKGMYANIIDSLRKHFPLARIGLCKEPQRMRDAFDISKEDCNCQV